jgi:hypothetical protein
MIQFDINLDDEVILNISFFIFDEKKIYLN